VITSLQTLEARHPRDRALEEAKRANAQADLTQYMMSGITLPAIREH
jgi:hypothetical protein